MSGVRGRLQTVVPGSRVTIALLARGLAGCQSAGGLAFARSATTWRGLQGAPVHGTHTSPNEATLPADVGIAPPGPDVPPQLAQFSGIWAGWMGNQGKHREGSTKLAVETLTGTGASSSMPMRISEFRSLRRAFP